ncbi:MAG: hypothetical protein CVT92_11245 [Bacteroidetes bacterium HGW-Bacteroidetes-1]|jgi:hypothetical protein|nr:MAG: hypothetical protein CVT92_11245 [Bacteroidetes bacterium HGW-Bacteroidetes-1]
MNDISAKEKLERQQLNQFIALYPDFPKGKIVRNESPDFIVKTSRKSAIGIEITRLMPHYFLSEQQHMQIGLPKFERLKSATLIDLILMKEAKLPLYFANHLKQVWLLIVIVPSPSGRKIILPSNMSDWQIKSKFDKIFLLNAEKNHLECLIC